MELSSLGLFSLFTGIIFAILKFDPAHDRHVTHRVMYRTRKARGGAYGSWRLFNGFRFSINETYHVPFNSLRDGERDAQSREEVSLSCT
ncbi:hypothetical protein Csa_008352 [Cucumis sativus]|uniref:Uncharacterized protein n=1 Tax=Cucumis sativus TaxID=3659 RepID=A0A0A0KQE8_CUCSA|nr:hypothetical protein Csa_008352 [Cucumis sativus]